MPATAVTSAPSSAADGSHHPAIMKFRILLALVAALTLAAPPAAQAQVARNFPYNALRGDIGMLSPPDVLLNDEPARLAPGVRIRGGDNMLVMSADAVGQRFAVLYTLDTLGLVKEVWLLRPEEQAMPWPRSAEEAASLRFDPIAQTWSKP